MVTAQCQVESLIIAVIMRMKFFTTAAILIATAAAAVGKTALCIWHLLLM